VINIVRGGDVTHTLFISYSHGDNKEHHWLERLTTFLDALNEELPIEVWADRRIGTGEKWRDEIAHAISRASAAVLLVSPGFLASKFIKENELPQLLRAKDAGVLKLYLLVVAFSPWKHTILEKYQAFNNPNNPLESMPEPEQNMWLNKLVVTIADDMRAMQIVPAKKVSAAKDLRAAIATINGHLDATRAAFIAQARRRNDLVEAMRKRLKIIEQLEYERFFFRYYERMDEEELFEFAQIRAITEGTLHDNNRSILEIIEGNPSVRDELPILAALRRHLILWLNKYDKVFLKSEKMSILYVGVEDGVPFPKGVDEAVSHWLNENRV